MYVMKPLVPANDLEFLPPKAEVESRSILKKAISANTELARLKGYCSRLPNETILLNTIVLQEARASSEIENIITTHDDLYQALVTDQSRVGAETKEVLNYRSAVWKGYELLRANEVITSRTILSIQQELEQNNAGIRKLPGTALVNDRTGEIVYTPPDNEQAILKLLKNFEEYANADDSVDPLIKMAILHYQFESIHPFYDGNGRTGRILNVLYLIKEHLIESPVLYLSRYIIRNKTRYYELLQRVRTDNDWNDWIDFMLTAVAQTAKLTLETSQRIVQLMEETIAYAREKLAKTTYSKELVELLFVQPYVKIEHLVANGIAERRTASKYLKELEQIGVLESYKAWRETIYINRQLMDVIRASG